MSSLTRRIAVVFRSSKRILIFAAPATFACTLFAAHGLTQQDKERLLEKQIHPKEPLRLKAIKGKKGGVNISKKFLDGDDWLKGLTFRLENISDKNIIFVQVEVEFPRSDDVPPLVFPLQYGTGLLPNDSPPANPVAPIRPGEDVVLSLSDAPYEALQQLLGEMKYPKSIKHAILDLRTVIFDDGIMWRAGRLMKRDPNNPRRWIGVDGLSETGFVPKRLRGGRNTLSHNPKSFWHSRSKSGDKANSSTRKPVPQGCDDYTTIISPCTLSCDADTDERPPNPDVCSNAYCWRGLCPTIPRRPIIAGQDK